MRKVGVGACAVTAIVLAVGAAEIAKAAPPKGGGGAGAAHGPAAHFTAPRGSPHFTAHHAPPNAASRQASSHGGALATVHGAFAGPTSPQSFATRRQFAAYPAFRPFLGRGWWHWHNHLGWVGPWFWPFAYGGFFYYALWPYAYDSYDPFWAYGYNDIYAGMFSPYDYEPYVQGPQAPARMASLTQSMKSACDSEAAEVTGWPIDQIQQVIQPNAEQRALLDDLGNAIVKASSNITSHCPSSVAFIPVDRLAQMEVRLQGMIDAVNAIDPPLTRFYDSLTDEQKARFNEMNAGRGATASTGVSTPPAAGPANPQEACGAGPIMAWPVEKIDQLLKPDAAQKEKLQALQSAAAQAADTIKAACPSEVPATPPGRLAAIGQRLQTQLTAVQTVEAPLKDFYDSLSDDQKARFNNIGQQILPKGDQ